MNRSTCANLIREIRITACLTQKQFAATIGMTPLSVSRYERGIQQPSFTALAEIMDVAKSYDMDIKSTDFDLQPRRPRSRWKLSK